jgi:hypothetical protein
MTPLEYLSQSLLPHDGNSQMVKGLGACTVFLAASRTLFVRAPRRPAACAVHCARVFVLHAVLCAMSHSFLRALLCSRSARVAVGGSR